MIALFLIGLTFLVYFSYFDLKKQEVENMPILLFLLFGSIFALISKNFIATGILASFMGIVVYYLWAMDSLGGADAKILFALPFYLGLKGVIESLVGLWFYLILLLFVGTTYGLLGKLIIKKKEIAFIPAITLTYLIFWLFRYFWLK